MIVNYMKFMRQKFYIEYNHLINSYAKTNQINLIKKSHKIMDFNSFPCLERCYVRRPEASEDCPNETT